MDWSTSALLAAVLWVDGIRRVRAGSLILQCVLWGPWRVREVASRDAWRDVGWWPPLSLGIVLPMVGLPRSGPIIRETVSPAAADQAAPEVRGPITPLSFRDQIRASDVSDTPAAGAAAAPDGASDLAARLASIAGQVRVLRVLGAMVVLGMVVGVPAATQQFGIL